MASVGVGFRTVQDVLIEVSLRLIENYVNTIVTEPVSAGLQTVTVGSTASIYVGAVLVIDTGSAAEVVTITAVDPVGGTITATFVNAHSAMVILWGATFPAQQPTDPLFTQNEMLGYLARAQNEFLSKVPCFYELFQLTVPYGQIFQSLPDVATQLDRVALSTVFIPIVSLTRTSGEVTAVTVSPHGLVKGSTPYIVVTQGTPDTGYGDGGYGDGGYGGDNETDTSFNGVFKIDSVPNPTTFTYPQFADDDTSGAATALYWIRLYEVTMSELTMQNRNWRNDFSNAPTAFFEDRSGLYQWGVNANPSSNFPVELLVPIRDTDILGFLDGFLVPDICMHYVIYKMLEYIFSKDGVRSQPMLSAYCKGRFDRGVETTNRFIDNMLSLKSGRR